MDEKFIVREQERLAREQKRKKNRKKWRIAGIVLLALIIGVTVFFFVRSRLKPVSVENTVKIEAGDGQEIVFAGLTSVKGNEITYRLAEELEEEDEDGDEDSEKEEKPGKGQFPGGEGMPDMSQFGSGEGMPDMSQFGGGEGMPDMSQMFGGGEGMPDMSQMFGGGEMPDMSNMPQMGSMGGGNRSNQASASTDTFTYEGVTYELTREQVTTMIPVGCDVITKLGTVTTFSRLAAGDVVALVVEEEDDEQIIVGVYIVG